MSTILNKDRYGYRDLSERWDYLCVQGRYVRLARDFSGRQDDLCVQGRSVRLARDLSERWDYLCVQDVLYGSPENQ
jgi:hypothetical protein